MSHRLRDGVSACLVADRLVFLDLPGDRYFCLAPAPERAVRALLDGVSPAPDALARLEADGLLVPSTSGDRARLCPAMPACRDLDLDDLSIRSAQGLGAALWHLTAASLALRVRGLAHVVGDLSRRKARLRTPADDASRIDGTAAAFATARGLVAAHDRCLPRSLAIARRLVAVGVAPTLVIGVKLQPFGAHCWVTCGERLVDERAEDVRHFTPILIV